MSTANEVIWCDRGWQPVEYGFCPSRKGWKRVMRRLGANEPYPCTDARTTTFQKDGKTRIIVTIRDGAEKEHTPVEIAGLLVHEATHVWQEVQAVMGENSPSVEFEAYSMQAIFQELYEAFLASRSGK